jgi:AcrR family transcriptional regulator
MIRSSRANGLQPRGANARWAGNAPDREEQRTVVKKRAILRAAAALFRERGYERTRLDDIAQALNVTKPTLYYYVKNKEEILVEIQQTGFDEIMEELIELGRGAQSGADILRRVIVRYVNCVTGEFGVCVPRHFLITLAPENLARLRKARRTVERKIRETIARGIEDGSLRPCEPWIVATAIVGTMNWMAFWYEAGPTRRSAAELGDAYFDLLIEGIGASDVRSGASRVRAADGASPVAARRASPKRSPAATRLAAAKGPAAAKKPATAKGRPVAKRRVGSVGRVGKASSAV